MPAVTIRQLQALTGIVGFTRSDEQRQVLARQAQMLLRSSEEGIPEASDREDVRARYDAFLEALGRLTAPLPAQSPEEVVEGASSR